MGIAVGCDARALWLALCLPWLFAACSNDAKLHDGRAVESQSDAGEYADLAVTDARDADLAGGDSASELDASWSAPDLAGSSSTADTASVDPPLDLVGATYEADMAIAAADLGATLDLGATFDLKTSDLVAPSDLASNPKRVFVTKHSYSGANVLDACQESATDAGLGGTWIPWLSTPFVDAKTTIKGNGPWRTFGGATVFADAAQLASVPTVGINNDEYGAFVETGWYVWTGTKTGGVATGWSCDFWQASSFTYGTVGRTGSIAGWTEVDTFDCGWDARVYCFEQ